MNILAFIIGIFVSIAVILHYKKYQREQSKADQLAFAVVENNALARGIGLFQG